MAREYRVESKIGDVVKLPSGDIGIVIGCNFLCGGNVKEIHVFPLIPGFWRKLFLGLRYSLWRFSENEIDELKKVGGIFYNS